MHTIEKSAQIWVLQKSTGLPELQTIRDDDLRAIAKEFGVQLIEALGYDTELTYVKKK